LTESTSRVAAALADRYQIERELGRGGTATVYLAQDLRHGRRVAIKVLYPELAASLGAERFLREVEIAAGLSHPNILALYDSGESDGLLYYVMPFIEGESLRHRLRREIQMPVDEASRIARDVAGALGFAHRHGIVHRDIKPENILLEGDRAFVADFGVARAIETASSERLTETGLAVGTATYMSPEQAAGRGRVDGRSDVYSLGCVLFEMLAGEPPFAGGTQQAIIAKHMQAAVPDLRVVRPSVTRRLRKVILTALAKVPADRYATADDLGRALASAAAETRRPTVPRRAAILGLGVLGVAGLGLWSARDRLVGHADGVPTQDVVPGPRKIAVLYFDNQSGDSALGQIADGITEELIYELSGVNAFRVVSRNGVAPYRGRRVPVDSLVARIGVNTVIDGSVQRSGDHLRVRVQLIDARSDTYLDSLSSELPMAQASDSVRVVAQEMAARLRRQMGQEVRLEDAGLGTASPAARDLARLAQREREDARSIAESPHVEDLGTAREALIRADSFLVLAQAADPNWPHPWVARGWIVADQAALTTGEARAALLKRALTLAEAAVRRAPGDPLALELRGAIRMRLVNELQAAPEEPDRMLRAEADLRAALDRDSTLTIAWGTLGDLLWTKGSTAEAVIASRRALAEDAYLSEAYTIYRDLFYSDLMLGNFREAGEWCRRGRVTFPGHWRFVECELTLMRHDTRRSADPDSAWALVKRLEQLDPPERAHLEGRDYHLIYRRVLAATMSARAGRPGIARAELARARRAVARDSTLSIDLKYDEAYLRLVLGERDRAVRLLSEYVTARPLAREYLARDPLLRGLRPASRDTLTPDR
jgi:eukaryotic-like serine/threonine-protein kinase